MDFGTVTKLLLEGQYDSVDQFEADCRLVLDNCTLYYGGREDGVIFTEHASRLSAVLQQQMSALKKYIKSPQGEALRRAAQNVVNTFSLPKPPIQLLLGIISDLRALKYTDKATKVRIACLVSMLPQFAHLFIRSQNLPWLNSRSPYPCLLSQTMCKR